MPGKFFLYVRPELFQEISQSIRRDLRCPVSKRPVGGPVARRMVRSGQTCGNAIAKNFGIIELLPPGIGTRNNEPCQRVLSPSPETTMPHPEIPRILVKEGWKYRPRHKVADRLVRKCGSVSNSITACPLPPRRVSIIGLGFERDETDNYKFIGIERPLGHKLELLLFGDRRNLTIRVNGRIIRHHAENAVILLLCTRLRALRIRVSLLLIRLGGR